VRYGANVSALTKSDTNTKLAIKMYCDKQRNVVIWKCIKFSWINYIRAPSIA